LRQFVRDYQESQEWWERKKFLSSRKDSRSAIEQ
jgi:hypothetical protein